MAQHDTSRLPLRLEGLKVHHALETLVATVKVLNPRMISHL
jgi:hypothetical protein